MRAITSKTMAAIAALSICSTAAYAAPATQPAKSAPVKMTDKKLDGVTAGTGYKSGARFTTVCSFGNNCSGNGGSKNGNSAGLINVGNGTAAGSSILSGNSVTVSASVG